MAEVRSERGRLASVPSCKAERRPVTRGTFVLWIVFECSSVDARLIKIARPRDMRAVVGGE